MTIPMPSPGVLPQFRLTQYKDGLYALYECQNFNLNETGSGLFLPTMGWKWASVSIFAPAWATAVVEAKWGTDVASDLVSLLPAVQFTATNRSIQRFDVSTVPSITLIPTTAEGSASYATARVYLTR